MDDWVRIAIIIVGFVLAFALFILINELIDYVKTKKRYYNILIKEKEYKDGQE